MQQSILCGAPSHICKHRLPRQRELLSEAKLRERYQKFVVYYFLSLSHFSAKNEGSLVRGSLYLCTNYNLYRNRRDSPCGCPHLIYNKLGQGRALSLRHDMKYNLIVAVNLQYSFRREQAPALPMIINAKHCISSPAGCISSSLACISSTLCVVFFSPSVIFQKKNDSSLVRGSLCLCVIFNLHITVGQGLAPAADKHQIP